MDSKRTRTMRRAAAIAVGVLAVIVTVTIAQAQPAGGLTIKGTRWVNGVAKKVRCSATEGNTFEANSSWDRTLKLVYSSSCGIWADADVNRELIFSGPEAFVVQNGQPTKDFTFIGRQVADGPSNISDPARGTLSALVKCSAAYVCSSAEGTLAYERYSASGKRIMFVGTYRVKF